MGFDIFGTNARAQFQAETTRRMLEDEYRRRARAHVPTFRGSMNEAEARALLAYSGPLGDKEAIAAAFAKAAKAAHPDTGGQGGDMGKLKDARTYLLSSNIVSEQPCPMCNGAGIVPSQSFGMQCQNCKGTGIKP